MEADTGGGQDRQSVGGMEGLVLAGKYQLIRLLGQGGMGAVYEGRNAVTLKRCAVKLLLSPELGRSPEVVKRFFREAQASSVIESDHVVTIYDSGVDPQNNYPYMVMEMLHGEDLEHSLKRLGVLHPVVAAKLVLQSATGLAKAHEKSIVHRDIKPANLFLTGRDSGELVVKLLDFGIAKVKMENFSETSSGLTRTGSMLGTPLYMSPEQAKGSSQIDARSDVWSLGVVLYELLSGRLPFEDANSLGELMVSIITADIPLLQDKAPWVPPELAEITHRAMSRDINKRFQHAGEFRDALAAVVQDGPRVTPDMLVAVAQDQRAWVAPRLQLTDDGMLRATTRTGLAMTQNQPPPKKSSAGLVAGALGLVAVLGVGGVVAIKTMKREQGSGPAPTVTVVREIEKQTVIQAATETKAFPLEISPGDAEVTVDGEKIAVSEGQILIKGAPGATKKVKVSAKGQEKEQVVAITETGLIPTAIKVETRYVGPAAKGTAKDETAGKPPEVAPGPGKPKAKPAVVTNTDEFK